MAISTFSLKNMVLSVNGAQVTGLASGDDALSVETPERVTGKNSIDGQGAIAINTNVEGTIKVKLLSFSKSMNVFDLMYQDLQTGSPTPAVVSLAHNGGAFLLTGEFVVKGAPQNISFGNEVPEMEWELYSPSIFFSPGSLGSS